MGRGQTQIGEDFKEPSREIEDEDEDDRSLNGGDKGGRDDAGKLDGFPGRREVEDEEEEERKGKKEEGRRKGRGELFEYCGVRLLQLVITYYYYYYDLVTVTS